MGDVSAPRSLRQIQNRLAYCSRHHPGCNIRDETSDIRPSRFLSINLAPSSASGESEADKIKLIEATLANNEPYIILSYVWGHIQTIQTTAETIGQHKSGILTATLPQTIRDAITVTRKLGVGLLWVDSLCIVQDDAEELAREVAKMSSYYRNA
ncbi:heterokaryon incompatibility protein-domain-containing protein, partial [Bombardia bombarda]